jgi:hypothetical protein
VVLTFYWFQTQFFSITKMNARIDKGNLTSIPLTRLQPPVALGEPRHDLRQMTPGHAECARG